ncbi:hypothetical protein [Nitrososphaera sp.]|uniref:hypothetical protein n=1 Tax=Nitrososphaera sp. TaxID=1971748 RepID=UPI002ED7C6D8
MRHQANILELVWTYREEKDTDKKTKLYNKIRKKLSYQPELKMPSMITDDFVDSALDRI